MAREGTCLADRTWIVTTSSRRRLGIQGSSPAPDQPTASPRPGPTGGRVRETSRPLSAQIQRPLTARSCRLGTDCCAVASVDREGLPTPSLRPSADSQAIEQRRSPARCEQVRHATDNPEPAAVKRAWSMLSRTTQGRCSRRLMCYTLGLKIVPLSVP